jgi:hypothetical protein
MDSRLFDNVKSENSTAAMNTKFERSQNNDTLRFTSILAAS